MKRFLLILVAGITAILHSPAIRAVESADSTGVVRPVLSAYTVEIGSARIADTYLSPLYYDGWHTGLTYQRYQAMSFAPDRWAMSLTAALSLDKADNPARNASMWDISLNLDWGMMRRWRPTGCLTLAGGASTSATVGAVYNPRNGNNPVSAKAAWTVNLTGFASLRTRIASLPVVVTYRPTLPVTGIFFSPAYGELYYEIYLGNTSGLVRPAWWGNYFMFDNLLTADFQFSATWLRIGYHGRIFSSRASHITTNIFTHAFVVGIAGEWLSLNPRRNTPSLHSRKINALY